MQERGSKLWHRKLIKGTVLIMLGLLSFLTGCKDDDREVEGGSYTNVDKKAPTEIVSEEIDSFSCEVYTNAFSKLDDGLDWGKYVFKVNRDEESGRLTGTYSFTDSHDNLIRPEFAFEPDGEFLKRVDQIIKDSNIVKINGTHHKTNGIPDEFGSDISVKYSSGEYISCSDNQSSQIGCGIIKAFNDLFYTASGAAAYYESDDLNSLYLSVYEKDKYSLWIYAYREPDGTCSLKATEKIEKKQTSYGPKTIDKTVMDYVADEYEKNELGSINEYPRREINVYYDMELRFGNTDHTVRNNTAISDEQCIALERIKDHLLELVKQ